jgi:hypothetical protein
MLTNEIPTDVQALRPITLSPCTKLEEIRVSLRDARDPGPGIIHLFDSVTSPHLSRIILHFIVPFNSRKIDSSLYPDEWSQLDECLCGLAERLRVMDESICSVLDPAGSWMVPTQKREVKRLRVMIEARFLFASMNVDKVDCGAFLSRFREVGDVVFVPQKIRTLNEDGADGHPQSYKGFS